MTEHKITQGVPWPPHPEARYMLSRWMCSCGWYGMPFRDTRSESDQDERSQLKAEADDHAMAANMTEHDTPSTAHTEAERRHARGELYRLDASRVTTFVEGAEWALAQVREGLNGLPRWVDFSGLIDRSEALAVVDHLEGKP